MISFWLSYLAFSMATKLVEFAVAISYRPGRLVTVIVVCWMAMVGNNGCIIRWNYQSQSYQWYQYD